MALKQITAADFNAAIKKLTTSDASVWWKTLGTTEEGTELCFVMGWNDGYDEEDDLYQKDGYTLCSKIGYKPSNLMVMDYTDFNMPYDKKTAEVWDTDMSVGKGEVTDDAFDVKWYNDEAEAIWKKYGNPDKEGKTALDLMESKKKESLADNANLDFKVGDFKGTRKSVISKIKKALDNKGIANEVVADGRCLEVTLDNANVVIQTIAAGGYGSNKSASYVVLAKDSDDYRKQTDAYSIKDVMDYIEDAKGGKSESKKHICSMQKKKESLAKKSEATYNPDKVKADEMRLDYLSGVDDFYDGVKKYGFDLDDNGYWGSGKDGVYYRTIWLKNGKRTSGPNTNHIVKIGYDTNENTPFVAIDQYVLGNVQDLLTVIADNFAPKTMEALAKKSESKKHTCSMQKKKESLGKKSEAKYDGPVTLYGSTRYDDAEEAQKFLDGIGGGQVTVSKERNGDTVSVSIEGSDEDIDAFLEVYKDNYDNLENDCDANVMGWTAPSDLKYLTVQGRKELTGESKKQEADGEDSQATYAVCFDYVQTMCKSVKANSVEDAVEKARQTISKDMQVCEIWCNEKTLPNGTKVYLDGKDSDEKSYTEGGWGVV